MSEEIYHLIQKFWNLFREQKYEESLNITNKILDIEPNSVDALSLKGLSLRLMRKYDDSLQCFDKILEINPESSTGFAGKASVLDDLGRYEEAVECHKKSDESRETSWNNSYLHTEEEGYYQLRNGAFEDAIKTFDKILGNIPDDYKILLAKSEAEIQINDIDNGLKDLERGLELGKENNFRLYDLSGSVGKDFRYWFNQIKEDEAFNKVRGERRFEAIFDKLSR